MAKKVTISLDDEVLRFVDREAASSGGRANRSGYINAILAQVRRQQLDQELAAAYQRDAKDPEWQELAREWDGLAGDGINA